jgi:hypothetical protein
MIVSNGGSPTQLGELKEVAFRDSNGDKIANSGNTRANLLRFFRRFAVGLKRAHDYRVQLVHPGKVLFASVR